MSATNQVLPLSIQMEQEMFRLGHRNLLAHVLGNSGLALLVAVAVWGVVAPETVQVWLGMLLALSVLLVVGWLAFRDKARTEPLRPETLGAWRATNFALVTVAGIGWGQLGMLFVQGEEVNNLIVMTSFAGALAYSASSNVYDMKGFVASVVIATVLLLSRLPQAFGEQALVVGGMCVLYLSLLCMIAHSSHATLSESIRLRVSNETLARENAEQAARALKANRDKSEFLAAASHDLRQPVHALMLLIEAYRQSEPVASRHPLVQQIATAGQAVGDLFHALMELSRLETGAEKPVIAQVDLGALLVKLHQRWLPEAQRKQLEWRLRRSPRVAAMKALTDGVLLERVLGNLLSNALRYTRTGGVLLSLRVGPGGQGLCVDVWDTGIGIDPDDRERIFDPYVQVGNQERDRSKGLGLGLSIVRQACALLGLTLTLHSQPGRGSRFRLYLPDTVVESRTERTLTSIGGAEAQQKPVQGVQERQTRALYQKRILLIDDDPMVMQALTALLGSWGMDWRGASGGHLEDVLASMEAGWEPQCILSDFRLPGPFQGVELLDLLLDRYPRAVGVLQTGEMAQQVQATADEAGYLVLFKPVSSAMLANTLYALLCSGQAMDDTSMDMKP